jgi:hypothetical protein
MMAGEIRERIRFNFIKGATITEGRGSHRGGFIFIILLQYTKYNCKNRILLFAESESMILQ